MIHTEREMTYGPFTDVACVVKRTWGPFHIKKVYTAEKLYKMFTDGWCDPNIIDPAIRARCYNSMLVEKIYGNGIYDGEVKPYIKIEPVTIELQDGMVLHGTELGCGYKKLGLTVVCANNDPDPMQFPSVAKYVTTCMKTIGFNERAITLMGEMKTILTEDEGGGDNAH